MSRNVSKCLPTNEGPAQKYEFWWFCQDLPAVSVSKYVVWKRKYMMTFLYILWLRNSTLVSRPLLVICQKVQNSEPPLEKGNIYYYYLCATVGKRGTGWVRSLHASQLFALIVLTSLTFCATALVWEMLQGNKSAKHKPT